MKTIGVKNLRSLENIENIKISPLTLFIGKNSSGKSTLLRLFPLLKQSILNDIQESLLWYGDYVDFGTYDESLTKSNNQKKNMELSFDFVLSKEAILKTTRWIIRNKEYAQYISDKNIRLIIKFNKISFEEIYILYEDQEITILFDEVNKPEKIIINGEEFFSPKYLFFRNNNSFLPDAFNFDYEKNQIASPHFVDDMTSCISGAIHGNTNVRTIEESIKKFVLGSKSEISFSVVNSGLPMSTLQKYNDDNNGLKSKINNMMIFGNIENIITLINKYFLTYFRGVQYIKPIRAHGERYYRYQGLSVKEIDPSGNNIPAYLDSLTSHYKQKFKDWCMENFGFFFYSKPSGGHFSVIMSNGESKEDKNITDLGFGFSQILPIIISLWELEKKDLPLTKSIIVIEQPELHLHPSMQKQLMRTIAKIINKMNEKKQKLSLIIETHSEHIINEIGILVYKEVINKDDVNVCVFDKEEHKNTEISQLSYNNKGFIDNWPIGFFD